MFDQFITNLISEELSEEKSYILCQAELRTADFVYFMLHKLDSLKIEANEFVLNYMFLNSFQKTKYEIFKDEQKEYQKLDAWVFKCVSTNINKNQENVLEMLPNLLRNVYYPLYYVDQVKRVFETANNTSHQILAFESLMVLIGLYGYEYQGFYDVLYKMIQRELGKMKNETGQLKKNDSLFRNKFASKFCGLVDIALKQTSLSKLYFCSCIKLLGGIAILLDSNSCLLVSKVIFNLIKR